MTSSSSDDRDDLRLAQAGDSQAFARLVAVHAGMIWLSARALCRDQHEAEDLSQETFVEAWRSLKRFDGRCRFSTWLFGILRHRFLKSRRKPTPISASDELAAEVPVSTAAAHSPAAMAEQSEDSTKLRTALAQLPEEHRVVVELRFLAGASLEEIAAALDCPLGTVKSRLHNALEKLRRAKISVNLFSELRESPGQNDS